MHVCTRVCARVCACACICTTQKFCYVSVVVEARDSSSVIKSLLAIVIVSVVVAIFFYFIFLLSINVYENELPHTSLAVWHISKNANQSSFHLIFPIRQTGGELVFRVRYELENIRVARAD